MIHIRDWIRKRISSNLFLLREMNHTKHGNFWFMEERPIEEIFKRLSDDQEKRESSPGERW